MLVPLLASSVTKIDFTIALELEGTEYKTVRVSCSKSTFAFL